MTFPTPPDPTDAVETGEPALTDFRPARELYPNLDLTREPVEFALFQAIPIDLMLKHHFVPVQEREGVLWLAMADPLDIPTQDLLRQQLKRPLRFAGAPLAQIQEVLKKSESGQKVMDEAGEALKIQVLHEEDLDEEVLDLERLTDKDEAPIVRLVDTRGSAAPQAGTCLPSAAPSPHRRPRSRSPGAGASPRSPTRSRAGASAGAS